MRGKAFGKCLLLLKLTLLKTGVDPKTVSSHVVVVTLSRRSLRELICNTLLHIVFSET